MYGGGGAVATPLWAFDGVYPGFQGQGGGSIGVGDDCMEKPSTDGNDWMCLLRKVSQIILRVIV